MTDLSGYALEMMRDGGELVLYRGRRQEDRSQGPATILVLAPASTTATPAALGHLEHEYALAAELDSAWAARPLGLVRDGERPMLVLEDPGGEPIDRALGRTRDLTALLRAAIALADALGQVHKRGLIHKDIKPAKVLLDSASRVWLTGFGIASRLPRERQDPGPPEIIAGTLAYMAPEQTGRMNRSIDARSDLYALGVTLYELCTRTLPFAADDPLEWVHCHIARQPTPPAERDAGIPAPLSAVIMKLLAKTAEERYQTAAGLAADLRRCLTEWESAGRIDPFTPGARDTSDRLLVPETLYGREREIEALRAAFEQVVAGGRPALALVSGSAGIGKSSVVHELHKALVPPRGLFAAGKCDQYRRDIPYATIAQACHTLVRQLLGRCEPELRRWRDALRQALEPNGRLIVDLVPALELVVGPQPPVPDLPASDAQHRFQTVFQRFLGVFARAEHPLALFLDDLQWLDAATLDLMERVFTGSELRHFLLVGAYRDNEVGPSHPLARTLSAMRAAGATIREVVLGPLVPADVEQLVADALHCEPARAAPLARLVHEKTGGNPFFAGQFLTALGDEGLVAFDPDALGWRWDLARVRARPVADNVVDLLVGKLTRLPAATREALQQLACLGNRAQTATLCVAHETSEPALHAALWEAVRAGLVFRLEDGYTFLHDRVQEAAYALVPEQARPARHLDIGRRLAAQHRGAPPEGAVFDIANQFNRAAALIDSQEEREQVAHFNLTAGGRARAATAYVSALDYFAAGAALLSDEGWARRQPLAFSLEFHRAECEFLTGDFAAAAARLSRLSHRATTATDRAAVTCLRVALYTTQDRPDRAIEVGLEYLAGVGIDWPLHPGAGMLQEEFARIWQQLGSRPIEALADLPLMRDPRWLAAMDVLTEIITPAVSTDRHLTGLIVGRMTNLSLEHGNTDASCFAYVHLALALGAQCGDYRAGFRFGTLALTLVDTRGLDRFSARVYKEFGAHVNPWTRHLRAGRPLIQRAFDAALARGDLTFAAYSCDNLVSIMLASGDPLADVEREAEHGMAFARTVGLGRVIDILTAQLGLVRTLRGVTPRFGTFDGIDEPRFEQHLEEDERLVLPACWYWIRKLQARVLAGDWASALDAAAEARRFFWVTAPFFEAAEYHFYSALARAAVFDAASADARAQHVDAVAAHHRQLEVWARHCPENFENRRALVAAEMARLDGRELDAERLYEAAIRSAHEHGFLQNEGLANELAARFHAARGFETIGHAYLRRARYCYQRWGADGKVRQMDESHPSLGEAAAALEPTATIAATVERLDLGTIVEMSQAISEEIVLEKLIHRLLVMAVEHAGADRGLLLLPEGEGQRVAAEAATGRDAVAVRFVGEPPTAATLPGSILEYVRRTHETVMLDDVSAENLFSSDAYLARSGVRSLLCLPLVKQGGLTGVLYLENRLASHVFTPARLEVLKLLASQAAISVENARLYADVQASEDRLRHLVDFVPLLIGTLDEDGRVIHVNRTAREYFGVEVDRFADSEDAHVTIYHPEDLEAVRRTLRRALTEGAAGEVEARLRRRDGQFRWLAIRYEPLRDEDGRIIRWYATGTDIEDRKQTEERLRNESLVLRDEIDEALMFGDIVGASAALRATLTQVSKVAPTDSTVLITGETGTGKELIARAIHKRSQRSTRIFVSVNCAAIPPSLIASELFGHEKGAFTGALQRRIGRFELAEGGTIFLDEIGELPAETQIALLRVLQEREFERVGGTRQLRANVRVIAATNGDLQAAIAGGTFRADLFYRLNVFPVAMPSLRERPADIPVLVRYFVERYSKNVGKRIRNVARESLELLQSYRWPGNVRELQNVIERAVIICETDTLTVDESWLPDAPGRVDPAFRMLARRASEDRAIIEAALSETKGRVAGPSGAAAKLGVPASTLESKIRSLGIDKHRFKPVY